MGCYDTMLLQQRYCNITSNDAKLCITSFIVIIKMKC